tara:strand:- start:320 stop:448 length:129 start_codon:yes stop_codon:yes gene_type:complete
MRTFLKQPYVIINKVEPKLDLKDTKKYLKKLKKKRKGEKYGK